MPTLREIKEKIKEKADNAKRKQANDQVAAWNRADRIISEDFHSFDNSICVKIFKVTHKDADEIKEWLYENCKGKFTYDTRWKFDNDNNNWYLNFYFASKKDAASFKIFWR